MADPFSIGSAYEIIKIARREGWIKNIFDLFRPKTKALLLGASGVGKSQFLESINDIASLPLSSGQRTEFSVNYNYDVGGLLFQLTDTPGQKEHHPRRVAALKDAIRQEFNGVINFVSYGYHEYGVPSDVVIQDSSLNQSYIESHRDKEIAQLNEWVPLIEAEWIITVVTKADIWWNDKESVLRHYNSGSYNEAISKYMPKAKLIVRPYSSISARFYGVLPNAASFDDSVRKQIRNELFHTLKDAAKAN